jgi:sugar lactone lactonase YvrE
MKMCLLVRTSTVTLLAIAAGALCATSSWAQSGGPKYEPDLLWPKPLPNEWTIGGLGGVCTDAQDHVFILNRQDAPPADLNAARMAPPIIEFDANGNVVNAWGDSKLLDARLHSCHVDKDNNIWIAAAPSGMVQKYTHDGSKLLLQIGKKGVVDSDDGTVKGKPLNSNAAQFFMPSSIDTDPQNGDVYVSDGEGTGVNRRVAVMDSSGKFLRQWQPEGMESVHCLTLGRDGLVYVCNRQHSRIQVYDKMGVLTRTIEVPWKPVTPPADGKVKETGGSVVALAFSPDPNQKYIFDINQNNAKVEIIDRETGKVVSSFGRVGQLPGEFNQIHGIATDTKGNIYVAENRGRRVLKFRPVGQ